MFYRQQAMEKIICPHEKGQHSIDSHQGFTNLFLEIMLLLSHLCELDSKFILVAFSGVKNLGVKVHYKVGKMTLCFCIVC